MSTWPNKKQYYYSHYNTGRKVLFREFPLSLRNVRCVFVSEPRIKADSLFIKRQSLFIAAPSKYSLETSYSTTKITTGQLRSDIFIYFFKSNVG